MYQYILIKILFAVHRCTVNKVSFSSHQIVFLKRDCLISYVWRKNLQRIDVTAKAISNAEKSYLRFSGLPTVSAIFQCVVLRTSFFTFHNLGHSYKGL